MTEQAFIIKVGRRYVYRNTGKSILTAHTKWGARFFHLDSEADQRELKNCKELLQSKKKAFEILKITLITEQHESTGHTRV